MGPKKVSNKDATKKKLITIEAKKEIIQKHEAEVRVVDLAQQYDRTTSEKGYVSQQMFNCDETGLLEKDVRKNVNYRRGEKVARSQAYER